MKMIPENVTLVVKAPNQQIEDQNIQCESSWTVGQLKGHLSEVYPSKPSTEEQKIIYSGQLLDDNIILKDVLRTYDDCPLIHTMHLVCTPKKKMPEPQAQPPTEVESPDGLRRRNTTEERPVENRPETRQNDQNHTVEMQNYLSSFVNNYGRVPPYPNYNMGEGYLPVSHDPAVIANHMMMMQQAYLQYMQQYANMWQAPNQAPPAAAAPEAPPAAPPAPEADEEGAPRDWLDHLYAASRLAVLFSLVYLYGSPARLLLVLVLCAAGYLHQIGFFRDLQVAPQEAARAAPAEPRDNANNNANNANNDANNANNDAANANANANANVPAPERDLNDNQQSLLAVTWMIFTSFFASLIPETN